MLDQHPSGGCRCICRRQRNDRDQSVPLSFERKHAECVVSNICERCLFKRDQEQLAQFSFCAVTRRFVPSAEVRRTPEINNDPQLLAVLRAESVETATLLGIGFSRTKRSLDPL